ncbi:MAG TPA: phosphoesterase, partial [Spirochaeta sp.]|nr:phosphoesterase [Spirochaeta sp.]
MKIIYTTDLYGNHTKYDRLVEAATEFHVDLVINGGDMFPKNIDLHKQDIFIRNELHKHFERFEQIGIHYLCCPGNDDLRIFDELFQQECGHFKYVYSKVSRLTGFA